MADINIVAKPYAKAAYAFAKQNNETQKWSDSLRSLSEFFARKNVKNVISNPSFSQLQVVEVATSELSCLSDKNILNFLKIVAEKNKLLALSEISKFFELYKNSDLGHKNAEIIVANDVEEEFLNNLKQKLAIKFNCKLDMYVQIRPEIIGGIIVKVDDYIIDDSIKGRLDKLKSILLS